MLSRQTAHPNCKSGAYLNCSDVYETDSPCQGFSVKMRIEHIGSPKAIPPTCWKKNV